MFHSQSDIPEDLKEPLPVIDRLTAVRSDTYDTFLHFLEALLTPYDPSDAKGYEEATAKYAIVASQLTMASAVLATTKR